MSHERSIEVGALTRVEGEGALRVKVDDGRVTDARLEIYEPPRFFETMLRGRSYTEPPDVTARVCGICPVAYQMTACRAIETACGVAVPPAVDDLRLLLYCGEWIASHALHVHLLHAPDFLGYDSAVAMARDHRDEVTRGLRLKKAGNLVLQTVGGRAIHPVNVRVGGFYRAPSRDELLRALEAPLASALDDAVEALRWTAGFEFPDATTADALVSLWEPGGYPVLGGEVVSTLGHHFEPEEFEDHVAERQVAHSTALHALLDGRTPYLTGALARFAHNAAGLSPVAAAEAAGAGLEPAERNPFRSILVRCAEIVHAVETALAVLDRYDPPDPPAVDVRPRAGTGAACTEAPRGLLYHRYDIGDDGLLRDVRIVPPTSQSQAAIERDLARVVESHLGLAHEPLRDLCERTIRSYDPCISCATHFLRLEVDAR